jgi:hypothetical protein
VVVASEAAALGWVVADWGRVTVAAREEATGAELGGVAAVVVRDWEAKGRGVVGPKAMVAVVKETVADVWEEGWVEGLRVVAWKAEATAREGEVLAVAAASVVAVRAEGSLAMVAVEATALGYVEAAWVASAAVEEAVVVAWAAAWAVMEGTLEVERMEGERAAIAAEVVTAVAAWGAAMEEEVKEAEMWVVVDAADALVADLAVAWVGAWAAGAWVA